MGEKICVGILCGGKSAEHEVSLQSTKNIVEAMEKYKVIIIGIHKTGEWYLLDRENFLENPENPKKIHLKESSELVACIPGKGRYSLISLKTHQPLGPVDVIFPVLHGPLGEDGVIQGLCKTLPLPFVGAGVLSSAIGMDKEITKRLLQKAGIPIAKFLSFSSSNSISSANFETIQQELGVPFFIKPARMGSSIGVNKISTEKEFLAALEEAFQYDSKILCEEYVEGREIECSVLGNEDPIASLPGEIIPQKDFYSYSAKYIDPEGAILKAPAELPENLVKEIQNLAIKTFRTLECKGMARVDVFVTQAGKVLVNEINTIPGFTKISMYPRLWELTGISYSQLIDRLIQLAIQEFQREQTLQNAVPNCNKI